MTFKYSVCKHKVPKNDLIEPTQFFELEKVVRFAKRHKLKCPLDILAQCRKYDGPQAHEITSLISDMLEKLPGTGNIMLSDWIEFVSHFVKEA